MVMMDIIVIIASDPRTGFSSSEQDKGFKQDRSDTFGSRTRAQEDGAQTVQAVHLSLAGTDAPLHDHQAS
jgi:hypothetical protein